MPIADQFISQDGPNPDKWTLSLAAVAGKKIKDIQGYISGELGDATFKLCDIVFEDGSIMGVEGEHDFPYITVYEKTNPQPEFVKNVDAIDREENPEDEEDEEDDEHG